MEREERKSEKAYTAAAGNKKKKEITLHKEEERKVKWTALLCVIMTNDYSELVVRYYFPRIL
jgi:hypothetical protein